MTDFFDDFLKLKLQRRTEIVDLSELKSDGPDKWHIQNLDAIEVAKVQNEVKQSRNITTFFNAALKAAGGNPEQVKQAVSQYVKLNDEKTPDEYIRGLAVFEFGSITPNKPPDRQAVVKFAAAYPVKFNMIVDRIWMLTGMGQEVKKKPLPTTES